MENRSYRSQRHCPIARALDVLGDRWCLLVLRDLRRGRHRFADLLDSLTGISPNVLSARIKTLEAAGVVERRMYTDHPPRAAYHLTDKGEALGPVLQAIADWGLTWEPRDEERADSLSP